MSKFTNAPTHTLRIVSVRSTMRNFCTLMTQPVPKSAMTRMIVTSVMPQKRTSLSLSPVTVSLTRDGSQSMTMPVAGSVEYGGDKFGQTLKLSTSVSQKPMT